MRIILLAFLIGVVSGLRSMTAPAAVSWAIQLSYLSARSTWLAFLGFRWTPWILSIAALGEIVGDKLPFAPSRKAPVPFLGRILSGGLCGGVIGATLNNLYLGLIFGAAGAVAGTLGGYAARAGLVRAIGGKDFPIALAEDIIAIVAAVCVLAFARG
jgi:uncharacterized membrane protein